MDATLLLGLLVLGVVVLTPLADRIGVPQPVLLTVYGVGVGAVPFVPAPTLPPDLILPLVLPPLLFAATQATSVSELRSAARPILTFAVGLTLVSAAAVALVAHQLGVPWPAAVVLGAIVAPPDPVAASAVASRLNLPPRLVTILEGEGQFNDATALVLYQLAVMAAVTGTVTAAQIAGGLALAVLGGIAIGLAGGVVARWALARLHDAAVETTITLAVPFALYLLADELGASGVLAVLVSGLFLRSKAHRATTADGFVLGRAVWRYVEFILSGLLFAFLGIELTSVLRSTPLMEGLALPLVAGSVLAVLVAVRAVVVFAATAAGKRRARGREGDAPESWREASVVSWAGMRGVVTVATALALPQSVDSGAAFPARDELVLVALVVVLATLVVQGLTLAPLISRLGVASTADTAAQQRELSRRAAQAALDRLVTDGGSERDEAPPELRDMVVEDYRHRIGQRDAARGAIDADATRSASQTLRTLVLTGTETERDVVLAARRSGEVSPAVADAALLDIETRSLRAGR